MTHAVPERRDRSNDVGASNQKAQKAALHCWNKILNERLPGHYAVRTWPDILHSAADPFEHVVTTKMFGCFADLLMNETIRNTDKNLAWLTISSYLSKIKNVIITDVRNTNNLEWSHRVQVLFGEGTSTGYFKKLISNLKAEQLRMHDTEGTDLVNQAEYMGRKHREQANRE